MPRAVRTGLLLPEDEYKRAADVYWHSLRHCSCTDATHATHAADSSAPNTHVAHSGPSHMFDSARL